MIKELKMMRSLKQASFNREITYIYEECKIPFLAWTKTQFVGLSYEDFEEAYNDAILALHDLVLSDRIQEDSNSSIQTYLNTVGRNRLIDIARKKNVNPMLLSEDVLDWSKADELWDEEADDVELEKKERVRRIMDKLLDPCKAILTRFYYENYSMERLAELLGYSSADSVKTQKNKCMNKIRVAVKQQGEE